MKLYFITGNTNKFEEISQIIPDIEQLKLDLPEIQELDPKKIIKAKLREAQKHHKGNFIVEDTSLYLEALNGLPGPLIKWHLESLGPEGLHNICNKLQNFKATAKTMIGLSLENDEIHFFEGKINGTITKPSTIKRFGWDPIFTPDGFNVCFAEMSLRDKNNISMRRKATEQLKEFLETIKV